MYANLINNTMDNFYLINDSLHTDKLVFLNDSLIAYGENL